MEWLLLWKGNRWLHYVTEGSKVSEFGEEDIKNLCEPRKWVSGDHEADTFVKRQTKKMLPMEFLRVK
mgnify:CR=1 FL=1